MTGMLSVDLEIQIYVSYFNLNKFISDQSKSQLSLSKITYTQI